MDDGTLTGSIACQGAPSEPREGVCTYCEQKRVIVERRRAEDGPKVGQEENLCRACSAFSALGDIIPRIPPHKVEVFAQGVRALESTWSEVSNLWEKQQLQPATAMPTSSDVKIDDRTGVVC